jgi:polyhydroxyalkanoate synthesis regulator phasin
MPPVKKESEDSASRSVLNPLDVMVITRERLQDTLDDAVRRGRMTRDDATDLLAEILRRAISAPTDRVIREVRRVTGAADEFPIADYDDLTAAQIVSQLGGLESPDLRRVRDYERRNANRKTVLAALDAKLA